MLVVLKLLPASASPQWLERHRLLDSVPRVSDSKVWGGPKSISNMFSDGNDAASQGSYFEHRCPKSRLANFFHEASHREYFKGSPGQYVDT